LSGAGTPTARQLAEAARGGVRATIQAILASAVLASAKVAAGLAGNSYALVADGVESVLDIFSSLVVLGSLRLSTVPQSERFPWGVGKVEPLGALVVATVLLVAAVGIASQAIHEIVTPHAAPEPFTLLVLVAVIVTKEVLFRRLFAQGADIGSRALQTDAWHHRADAITSAAAFVGISVALFFGEGWESADDWAALLACGVIAFNGVRLFRTALVEILDVAAPPEVEAEIRSLAAAVRGVAGIDKVRVRRSGLAFLVDIHVEVDGDLSVRRGHEIAHDVKGALLESRLPVLDALVHMEPVPAGEAADSGRGHS
jgi:cation diffusion facilitator family transporter